MTDAISDPENLSSAVLVEKPIDFLKPYERNNKKHPKEEIDELAKSIAKFGFENPILIEEDGTIISGHGRWMAAKQLGKVVLQVRVAVGMSKEDARKLRIAANKVTGTAYDSSLIQAELLDMKSLGMDLDNMGLSDREFQSLLTDVGEMDLDSLTSDISASVIIHEDEIERVAEEVETSEVPLAKAFGIKKVPVAGVRTVTRFLGVIEEQTGKTGLDALLAHMSEVVAVAA